MGLGVVQRRSMREERSCRWDGKGSEGKERKRDGEVKLGSMFGHHGGIFCFAREKNAVSAARFR